jgi:hypothetical protein
VTGGRRAGAVLAASGLVGLAVGVVGPREWQVAVETAQVLAGLVAYPPDNPFFIYHTKLWTILHQLCALALWAGVTERTVSTAVSGVVTMVTFQALALFVYALSRDAVVAVGSAVVIVASKAAEFGVIYPIFLTPTSHTYGVLGLSAAVLAAGLLGSGCWKPGLFLLGLLPAIHPSIGAWTMLMAAIALGLGGAAIHGEVKQAHRAFVAGLAISLGSLIVQLATVPQPARLASADAARYLTAFTLRWDGHRQPVPLDRPGVLLNVAALAIASGWLLGRGRDAAASWLLRFVAVCGVVSLACVLVSRVPVEALPGWLVILMPGRMLNVNAMTFAALVLGLAGASAGRLWGALLTIGFTAALVTARESLLWTWLAQKGFRPHPLLPVTIAIAGAAAALVAGAIATRARAGESGSAGLRWSTGAAMLAMLVPVAWSGVFPLPTRDVRAARLRDRTNEGVLAAAARGRGLLLTGGDLHLVQLRTRRPVLLDGGGLDALPYALESGPAMARILKEVYGVDLFDPPPEAYRSGAVPPATNQRIWEAYAPARWREIRRTFQVTQVLTPGGWQLQLPVVAGNMSMLLYEIPE